MRSKLCPLFLCGLLLMLNACKSDSNANQAQATNSSQATATNVNSTVAQTNAAPAPNAAQAGIDACALLKAEEVGAVQGSAIKEAKGSQRNDGDFLMSQCFYTAEKFEQSVSLTVMQNNPGNSSRRMKDFWEERFSRAEKSEGGRDEKEREKERDKKKDKDQAASRDRGEEEEAEGGKAERVQGIGDEAFWVKAGPSASLYVLKGDRYIIISLGGADAEQAKLNKTKQLAQKALKRL